MDDKKSRTTVKKDCLCINAMHIAYDIYFISIVDTLIFFIG